MSNKTIEDLMKIPYRVKIYCYDDNPDEIEWVAQYPDLPGCVGCGDTPQEALSMAEDAKKSWLQITLDDGDPIPQPLNPDINNYSGKFTLRLPKTFHKELSLQAEEEGVSLNQYLLYLLSLNFKKRDTKKEEDKKFIYNVLLSDFPLEVVQEWQRKMKSEKNVLLFQKKSRRK